MTVTTLRPNGVASISSFTVAGAGDAATALNDNSDSSWVNGSGGSVILDMGTVALPSGAVVVSLTPRTRAKPGGIIVSTHYNIRLSGVDGSDNVSTPPDNTTIYNYSGTPLVVRPTDAGAWTQADIDAVQFRVSGSGMSYYEGYIDVTYNVPPSVSSVTVAGQIREDPTVTWSYSDPDGDAQSGYQVKVFTAAVIAAGGFDAESSANVYDSGVVAGAATSHAANANLSPGHYGAYVKAKDAGTGNFGAWAAGNDFRVVNSPLMML